MIELDVVEEPSICGGCTACCTLLGVKTLEKDDYQTCKHECEAGCGIYEKRPEECNNYVCLYHEMHEGFSELFRPDNLRVICDLAVSGGNCCVNVRELDEGVYDREDFVRNFVEYLAFKHKAFVCVIYKQNYRTIFTPWTQHLEGKINIKHVGWREL